MALNSNTGNVTLTSEFADLTEDTTVMLTAMATDHGQPPLSSTGQSHSKLVTLKNTVYFIFTA